MELLIIIGAYIALRHLAKRGSEPSQQPTLPNVYLDEYKVFLVNRFMPLIQKTAKIIDIDPDILWALIYMVSRGDDGLMQVTADGEYGYGLTQITCSRAKTVAFPNEEVAPITDCRILGEPANSIWYGALYLQTLYQGDWLITLAKYYSPTMATIPHEQSLLAAQRTLMVAQTFRQITSFPTK